MRMFFAVFVLFKYINFFLQIIKKVFKLREYIHCKFAVFVVFFHRNDKAGYFFV